MKRHDSDLLSRIDERTSSLMIEVKDIKEQLTGGYVRKEEFEPIKRLVYGMVSLILIGFVGALLTLVFKK